MLKKADWSRFLAPYRTDFGTPGGFGEVADLVSVQAGTDPAPVSKQALIGLLQADPRHGSRAVPWYPPRAARAAALCGAFVPRSELCVPMACIKKMGAQ